MRDDLSEVRRNGLHIRRKDASFRVTKIRCYGSTEEIGPCDLVIVAVKTTSNADLIDLIPPLLRDQTALLTLQNGLGNEEFLAGHFDAERILGGLCFICVTRVSRTEVEAYDPGTLVIGEYVARENDRVEAIASCFAACGIKSRITNDLALERWRKLVWNVPFNSLSILAGRMTPGEVVSASDQLVADLLDAQYGAIVAPCVNPVPEGRAEVEAVVEILRLDEDVRVEQVGHQVTPRRSASSWKVESFLKPSISNASV